MKAAKKLTSKRSKKIKDIVKHEQFGPQLKQDKISFSSMLNVQELIYKRKNKNKEQFISMYEDDFQVFPASNNTLIFLIHYQDKGQLHKFRSKLIQIDTQGNIIWKQLFKRRISKIAMPKNNEIVLCEFGSQYLTIIELDNTKTYKVKFQFKSSQTLDFEVFSDSGLLLVMHRVQDTDNAFKLYYYDYQKLKKKPYYLTYLKTKQCIGQFGSVVKVNNYSKCGWIKQNGNGKLILKLISFDKYSEKINFYIIETINKISDCYGPNIRQLHFKNILEVSPYKYIVNAHKSFGARQINEQQKYPFFANLFVINVIPSKKYSLTQIQCFEELPSEVIGNYFSCSLLGRWITYYFENILQEKRSLYIYGSQKMPQKISEQQLMKSGSVYKKFRPPQWDLDAIVEYVIAFQPSVELIRIRKFFRMKDIYIQFLLTLNEDFDDDLLQDASQMLTC